VVYTDYRPTPLQHYMFPAGGDGLHLVVDERGAWGSGLGVLNAAAILWLLAGFLLAMGGRDAQQGDTGGVP
jgi:hypothetical protein